MYSVRRASPRAADSDIVRLNSVGLSLSTIASMLGCHPTTVTLRLKALNVAPSNTRRAFMEEVFDSLSPAEQEWLTGQLGPHISIKDFVLNLMVKEFLKENSTSTGQGQDTQQPD